MEFARDAVHGYQPAPVHAEVCAALERFSADVAARKSPRLMIFLPPRIGKSTLSSILFPAWHLGRHPAHEVIQGSYGQDLSRRFSRRCRSLVRANDACRQTFPALRLADGDATVDQWAVEGGGGYKAVGAGSAVTGQGAAVLILDDTCKNRAEAYSPQRREQVWGWYTWDLESRLAPGGGVLVVQTRWHHDDLPGRLLARDGERGAGGAWEVLRYPAVATQDERAADGSLWRRAGEALDPARYPADCEVYARARLSPLVWSALYQQDPTPEGGALLPLGAARRWTPQTLPAHFDRVLLSVDCKLKEGDSGSWVVAQVWGRKGADAYLLHQARGRWGIVQTVETLRALCATWQPQRVLIEDKAAGPSVIEVIRREIPGVVPVQVRESKIARAVAILPFYDAGNVHHPAAAPWLPEFELELGRFPGGGADDQVDALTQALADLYLGDSDLSWLHNWMG